MPFVYLATFKDGSVYVGQSSKSFEQLTKRYTSYTKTYVHSNLLRRTCKALGMPVLSILEECNVELLDERERHWIAAHNTGKLLNTMTGGISGSKAYKK